MKEGAGIHGFGFDELDRTSNQHTESIPSGVFHFAPRFQQLLLCCPVGGMIIATDGYRIFRSMQ